MPGTGVGVLLEAGSGVGAAPVPGPEVGVVEALEADDPPRERPPSNKYSFSKL